MDSNHSRLDRWARSAVFGLLSKAEAGEITLHDHETMTFGRLDPDEPRRAVIHVDDESCYRSILLGGTTGAAESYIHGKWRSDDLVSLIEIILASPHVYEGMDSGWAFIAERVGELLHRLNKNTRNGSLKNIVAHYDLGNEFFSVFLDETMAYSCGVFETPESTLRDASVAKFDRMCRNLKLTPSDHLLEIGSGWGGFAIHAAREYGCRVTTTTISREQHREARARVKAEGLDERVNVLDKDYRLLTGIYDKLASIEMIEAVGHHYLDKFFEVCSSLLKPDGMMGLQAITVTDQRYNKHKKLSSFINKYIFPGSNLVSVGAMCRSVARKTDMQLVQLHDITVHYARTLREWRHRFEANLDKVRAQGMSDDFIRMWVFYLAYCEAGFARRWTQDFQLFFAKPGCRPGSIPKGATC